MQESQFFELGHWRGKLGTASPKNTIDKAGIHTAPSQLPVKRSLPIKRGFAE